MQSRYLLLDQLLVAIGLARESNVGTTAVLLGRLVTKRKVHESVQSVFECLLAKPVTEMEITSQYIAFWGERGVMIHFKWFDETTRRRVAALLCGMVGQEMFEEEKTRLNGEARMSILRGYYVDSMERNCWRNHAMYQVLSMFARCAELEPFAYVSIHNVVSYALLVAGAKLIQMPKEKRLCNLCVTKWKTLTRASLSLHGIWCPPSATEETHGKR
jgi:hypothetical protein